MIEGSFVPERIFDLEHMYATFSLSLSLMYTSMFFLSKYGKLMSLFVLAKATLFQSRS